MSLDDSVEMLRDWAVGVHAEYEERMLDATAGLALVEAEDAAEEERVARMNTQAVESLGLGL